MNHNQLKNNRNHISQGRDSRIPSEKDRAMNSTADLKTRFVSTDSLFPINEQTKARSLQILRMEIADKEVHLVTNKRKIWQNQLRYADRDMLWFHISGCILMLFLMKMMCVHDVDMDYMITTSMLLTGVLGSFSVLQVGKVCFARIAELSETCFFNVRQMAAFDMVLSGIISLAALLAGILFTGLQWKISLLQIGLYLLVPFVFTQCCCLAVLLTEMGRRNPVMLLAVGIFLSVFFSLLASNPVLYEESMLFLWVIALLIGAVLLGIQIKVLFTAISKGEIVCTN